MQKVARPRQTGHVHELDMAQLSFVYMDLLGWATLPAADRRLNSSHSFAILAAFAASLAAFA